MISVYPIHGVGSLSTSTMVQWEDVRVILDCGPGTITEIWRRGLRLRGLSAVLLSHGHLDHLWGLPPLLWFLDQRQWSHEVLLVYPPEINSSIQQMLRIAGQPGFITLQPLSSNSKSVKVGRLVIQAFEVNHPSPSCGFTISEFLKPRLDVAKLEAGGIPKTKWSNLAQDKPVKFQSQTLHLSDYQLPARRRRIVYTGDTGPISHLKDTVWDADLLIIDASWVYPQWSPPEEAPHLTLRQAFEVFHQSHVKQVLLTHLTTRVSQIDYLKAIEELQQEFNCKIPVYLPSIEKIEFD
jgi:ribonuclease Z